MIQRHSDYILSALILLLILAFSSCSKNEEPINLEPVLTTLEASDITRTEATVSVNIETRGTGKLSYVRFLFGQSEDMNQSSADIVPESEIINFRLERLKPGTTYYFCAEGGNGAAVLKSEMMTFRTVSNDRPTMGGTIPLSSGPLGVIVEFEILDDGGESMLEAGCHIKETGSENIDSFLLPGNELTVGMHQIYIGGLKSGHKYVITPFASNSIGETPGTPLEFVTPETVTLTEPGNLSTILGSESINLKELTFAGKMNGDDFKFLRKLLGASALPGETIIKSSVEEIDISNIEIMEGGDSYDGSRYTQQGVISTGLFSGCVQLKEIALPMSATRIERNSFSGCCSLSVLTIPASISECMPSDDCVSLEYISVSQANKNYTGIEGVLLNGDASEILWFPLAKEGSFSIPPTVKAIGENAFRGTHIKVLTLPSGLKKIGRGAFSDSSLEDIALPDDMTNVQEGIFQSCSNLKVVRLGSRTEYVGSYAFDGCNLQDMFITADYPPYLATDAFPDNMDFYTNCVLHVPSSSIDIYRNHSKWGKFKAITAE